MNLKPEPLGFMLLKKTISFLTIFLFILFSASSVIFATEQDNEVVQAFDLFDQQNYIAAEPLFKSLINDKPELLMLYYYYGACRTENQHYSEDDLINLLNANPNEAPDKINYYLGIQYQALENWEQALKYFNKFKLASTPEIQTELKITEKIQQCFNQENPYKHLVAEKTEIFVTDTITEKINLIFSDTIEISNPDSTTLSLPDTLQYFTEKDISREVIPEPVLEIKETENKESGNQIEFRVNSKITYYNTDHFQTGAGKDFFDEGIKKQNELDVILNEIDNLRNEYLLAGTTSEKNSIGEKILTLENESYQLKNESTQLLYQAEKTENDYWENVSLNEIEEFVRDAEESKKENKITVKQGNTYAEPDSIPLINPAFLLNETATNVKEEKQTPDELVYKIQLGAYSRGLPAYVDRLFKKLSVIRKIENYTDENGIVVYTTGNLNNLEDAMQMQKQVRQEGVEDAYVVPYFSGKRITLEQAKKIEGEL